MSYSAIERSEETTNVPQVIVDATLASHKDSLICFGLLLLDAVLLFIAAARHTFWRDETQAWLIARDSTSIASLIHNLRYEGHPPLWHLLLYSIAKLSWNPDWMKAPNFLFAVIAAGLVLFCRSLSLPTRIGITFSYFFLFEYGVIDRNYMLGVVLLLGATLLVARRAPSHSWTVPILLSLAALSSLPALILAVAVWGVYLAQGLALYRRSGAAASWIVLRTGLLPGTLLVGFCALGSALVIRPPTDTGVFLSVQRDAHGAMGTLLCSGKFLVKAYMPIPVLAHRFWDQSYYDRLPHHLGIGIDFLGWALLAGLAVYFRHRVARYFFLAGSGLILLQMTISGRAYMRHVGWLFVCLVLALILEHAGWDTRFAATGRPRWQRWMLSTILASQIFGGVFALAVSLRYPFSSSLQVADFLRSRSLGMAPLVFESDMVGGSVLSYLERPTAYNLEQQRPASFVVWNREETLNRHLPSPAELNDASGGRGAPVLITDKPLTAERESGLKLHLVAVYGNDPSSDGDAICHDLYYIYR